MKVTFLQSGGFVGAPKGCDVDSALLEPAAAREIEELVHDSHLKASGKSLSVAARDLKHYEIVVEEGEGPATSIRVVFDDATVPASAGPLLAYLKQRAKPRPV